MGPLPHVSTSIDGSIDAIDEARVKQTIAAQHEHGLLVAILNSLLTAKGISERVNLKYRGVTANVTIGIPPHISIGSH